MLRIVKETTTALCQEGQWTNWTDEELLQEYRYTGIREAFGELVYRYEQKLHNYLYHYLGHSANADDIFQKTFLTVLEECGKFDVARKFSTWLYTIATNKANDLLRRAKRLSIVSIDAALIDTETCSIAGLLEGNEPEPLENLMDQEITDQVREAVEALPKPMKQAVYMVYFQGMTYREAAEVAGVHHVTLSQRVKTAVGKLNYMLKNVG